jgi:two-component system, NtrC family, nitrogen regulation sensor histidine kinase GlnL
MVAVVSPDGRCVFANASFENHLGLSRRSVQGGHVFDWFVDDNMVRETIAAVARNEFSTSRFDAQLHRSGAVGAEPLTVHVIVKQLDHSPHEKTPGRSQVFSSPLGGLAQSDRSGGSDNLLVELVEIGQQARLGREERVYSEAQITKELIRNLAHEIKNPLGGIRGAAQLLEMEIGAKRELTEYTQVIIHEADRLQLLVDRLLAPHRSPYLVGDVNIHEVCERVRSLVMVEFAKGLQIERDYDASIPEFRGDREQLIQAVLNIVQNAAQALTEQIAEGKALIVLRTRIARQLTLNKQRYRLALELHIQDNGPGVPESLRDRIFFPLVSGRDGGSGLGLTLAQTFVQHHMGLIECENAANGGALFKILIPLP